MLPTTFLLIFLSIPTSFYDSRIDRLRFPPNDAIIEYMKQNRKFIEYAEANAAIAVNPTTKIWWEDAVHEANEIQRLHWLFSCSTQEWDDMSRPFWDKWMGDIKSEMRPEWYASGYLPAFPYWRCVMVER